MKKLIITMVMIWLLSIVANAQNVTIKAVDSPAPDVFRRVAEQTGKNFVYSSELLRNMRVSVDVKNKSLKHTLSQMFKGSDIEYKVKGRNIVLTRRKQAKKRENLRKPSVDAAVASGLATVVPEQLGEVVVVSRLEAPAVETSQIGAKKLTAGEISSTPVLFGESDVLKALQLQPGIIGDGEGMAGIHVHGGDADGNLFMLDNVPLYQINHFAGLFSAFNVSAIRYIDFFKSSIPAKYDGRLSSFLDVRTKDGSHDGHHGSFRLGLTSGAFNIDGPIGEKTTYAVALRRSWFDVISIPIVALVNADSPDEKIRFQYAFMDFNGKVTHRFNSRTKGFVGVYFGDDALTTGSKWDDDSGWYDDDKLKMHWGNLVVQAGLNYRIKPSLTAEFTAAFTRFFSAIRHDYYIKEDFSGSKVYESTSLTKTDNNISDWIFRGDFDWRPDEVNRVRFGGAYTLHSFLPSRTTRKYTNMASTVTSRDSTWVYRANEVNLYIEDDMLVNEAWKVNAGFHGSLFSIDGKTRFGLGPRLSASYSPQASWAVKAAYSRTTQYVHQLCQSYLSFPTDQWVPVLGKFKPQTADKLSLGGYWQTANGSYTLSLEGFYKSMHNLVEYRDEYYLYPVVDMWNSRLCSGKGTAKGVDVKIEKTDGRITGHMAYSLGWSDRTFAEKNGGRTYPARFDHRHTVNILLNWNMSRSAQLSASWTGHSGSRFTFLPQMWESPGFINSGYNSDSPLQASLNNYQLPFYHRLDLSLTVRKSHGFWNISLYNAYCHMNTVAITRSYTKDNRPVFKKVKMLPVIPSISYTWQF